ncbi:MAG: ATP-dependent Clp protease adapter ClpS [Halobacteriovoraceae bacterium]|nr:ATP-dependent Clp protease adapter ClpS [Halobacteriovoraceae bacterium]MCB9095472.1 ATP-dependent Clp protease adapter ClpS [Halobacteriovoraceae bacterium]
MNDENEDINGDDEEQRGEQTDVVTLARIKLKKPRMYKVLMHNDDYTTMDFVIHVLKKFFNKNDQEAYSTMLKVHNEGVAICGIFTFEVAESKTMKVNRYAKEKSHPLKCSTEPCD